MSEHACGNGSKCWDTDREPPYQSTNVVDIGRYSNLIEQIQSKQGLETMKHALSLTLREGFRSASDLCEHTSRPRLTIRYHPI